MMFNKKKKKDKVIFPEDSKVLYGGSRVGKTEKPKVKETILKKLNKVKYKPPPPFVRKDGYLFIITFKNGEQHRVRQLKSAGKPQHFIDQIMAKGSIDGTVFYPPIMVKKIQWDEIQ